MSYAEFNAKEYSERLINHILLKIHYGFLNIELINHIKT